MRSISLEDMKIGNLLPKLKEMRLIGLGEVAHGSGGLHQLSANLIRFFIDQLNVETILLEAPLAAVERLNSKLLQGKPVDAADMGDLYFVWRSKDLLTFLNDLARMNRGRECPIQIFGIDVRQPALQIGELRQYARDNNLESRFMFPYIPDSSSAFKAMEAEFAKCQRVIEDADFQSMSDDFNRLAQTIEQDSNLSDARRARLLFYCQSVDSWLRTYHLISKGHYDDGFVSRDGGMFSSADFYLKNTLKYPVVILAHLGHLIYRNQQVESAHTFFAKGKLLGGKLRDILGIQYSVFALMAKQTSVLGQDGKITIFSAKPHGLEFQAPEKDDQINLIDTSKSNSITIGATDNDSDPLKETYPEISVKPSEQFDYAVIIKKAHPMVTPR